MSKTRVIIHVQGGLVQDVYSEDPRVDVQVVDDDNFECVHFGQHNSYWHDEDCEDHDRDDVATYVAGHAAINKLTHVW